MADFFDFDVASKSNLYTKLEQGENKLRVLSTVLGGFEGWYQEKPVRFDQEYRITPDEYATLDKDQFDSAKAKWRPFGVCIVWNYNAQAVQIWQFTQKAIIGGLQSLRRDADWGDLTNYDIKISKTGTGMETRYEVKPVAPKPLSKEIAEAYKDSGLAPGQVFTDQKNVDNIKNLRAAIQTSSGEPYNPRGIDPENIPF
jgi:hypothetical protein